MITSANTEGQIRCILGLVTSRLLTWRRVGKVGVLLKMKCFVSGSPPRLVSETDGGDPCPRRLLNCHWRLGSGRRQSRRQRSPILLGSGNDGRLTLRSHCPVPARHPSPDYISFICFPWFLLSIFVFIRWKYVFLCPFFGLIQILFNITQTLGLSAVTGLRCWADHANLVSGVSMRDLAAGELRHTSANVTAYLLKWNCSWP